MLSPAEENTKGLTPGKNYEFFIFSSEEEAKECADIEDTTQRLSCYDSLFAPQQIEDPKLVITQYDNSAEFHLISKILLNKKY